MIITQTPFRMSFFGGGTDMESFFRENGGAVLSTTFDKYCYVNVRHLPRFFDYSTELSYSKTERVTCIEDIQHPAIRNAMKMLDIKEKWHLLRNGDDYDISKLAGEVLRVAGADGKQEYTKDLELLRDFKNSFGETLELLRHPDTKGNPFDRTVMSIRSKILFHVF